MSFGIREYHEPLQKAVANAVHKGALVFAAASNDGANFGRAFPAKYPGVFCIHATDGNGRPSAFNPTADDKDVNFSLLGENVLSHWPAGTKGHNQPVNTMSGTSVATPIAAGLAASILSFIRQQEQNAPPGAELLGPWLRGAQAMDLVLKSMVRQAKGTFYDYITPHLLFDTNPTGNGGHRERAYERIKDVQRSMYN
jgi:subtilisin family serine protease